MPMAAVAPSTEAAPPKPLDHSEFSSNPNGELSEDQLQKILASPIELDLPSRVGVLPVITATDWHGPTPDYDHVPDGLSALVKGLRKDASFSLVTEMMPIPSGALGMEAQVVDIRANLVGVILAVLRPGVDPEETIGAVADPMAARNDAELMTDPPAGSVFRSCGMPCLQHRKMLVRFASCTRRQVSRLVSSAEWSPRSISPMLL